MNVVLREVARRQDGVFTRDQARAAGYTDHQISGRLRAGAWLPCCPGVYRVAGAPGS